MAKQFTNNQSDDVSIVHPLEEEFTQEKTIVKKYIYTVYVIVIIIGIYTGFVLANNTGSVSSDMQKSSQEEGKTTGSKDTTTFKDSADGTIEKGGLDGEGTHKLIRDGGPSQTVYLISSVVDLDQFAGKKVKVWGQTMAAQKAAWLMDVGKVDSE